MEKTNPITIQTMSPIPFVGKRNTDYNYIHKLKRMENAYPIKLLPLTNWTSLSAANAIYASRSILARVPGLKEVIIQPWCMEQSRLIPVPKEVLAQKDLIYTNHYLPQRETSIPIILEADFSPFGLGDNRRVTRQSLHVAQEVIERVQSVIIRHAASFERFKELYPENAHKARIIPYYIPGLEAVSTEERETKWSACSPLKILFVGNQARRKGLQNLINAYQLLKKKAIHHPIKLTVVTNFYDGMIEVPEEVEVLSNLTHEQVIELMRQTHIYALPSISDAYPYAFVEAIASGGVVLCPNWSPLKEIWEQFGAAVDVTSSEAIAAALEDMVERSAYYATIAQQAHEAFKTQYHHSVVGRAYFRVFEAARAKGQQG